MSEPKVFEALWGAAEVAARKAHAEAVPTPMVVEAWIVSEGPCGFASVTFSGKTAFGRWAKAAGRARKNSSKGLYVSTNNMSDKGYSQSIARAEAAAYAFAKVLCEAGIEAYAESRLD